MENAAFETTDRIASFEWWLATLGGLLERLAEEMSQEVKRMARKHLVFGYWFVGGYSLKKSPASR